MKLRDIIKKVINEALSNNPRDYYSDEELAKYNKIPGRMARLNQVVRDRGMETLPGLPPMEKPKVIGKAYKAFEIRNNLLYPVMVNNYDEKNTDSSKVVAVPSPVGVWVPAQVGKCVVDPSTGTRYVHQEKGGWLSFRPGWHLGLLPYATQFNKKKYGIMTDPNGLVLRNDPKKKDSKTVGSIGKYFPKHVVFAEVEYAIDEDLTDIMKAKGLTNGFDELPSTRIRDDYERENGRTPKERKLSPASYRFWTNTINASGEWVITSMMRIIRILPPSEVDRIIAKHTVGDAVSPEDRDKPWFKDRLNDPLKPQEREPGYPTDDEIRGTNNYLKKHYNLDYDPNDLEMKESVKRTKKIYLKESQIRMIKEIQDKEVVFFEFFRDIKHFLKDLLTDPINAYSDGVLKNEFGLSTKQLKKILLDRHIIVKKESFSEDFDDVKGKEISHYHITYRVPRGNFQSKIETLYRDLLTRKSIQESADGTIGLERGGEYYHMNDGFGNLDEDEMIDEPIEKEPTEDNVSQQPKPNGIKVLCACEESQAVCKAFRAMGFDAYSCDIQEASGGKPDWHIMGDALEALNSQDWDVVIAFPPCTHLASSGSRWWPEKQKDGRQKEAKDFFMKFVEYPCRWKAIENPAGIMSTLFRKPDQYINPSQFGDPWNKRTGLWLFGLPKLVPTNEVEPTNGSWVMSNHGSKTRSKTFPGIAGAMAQQWGTYILDKLGKR